MKRMNKTMALALLGVLCVTVSGCGSSAEKQTQQEEQAQQEKQTQQTASSSDSAKKAKELAAGVKYKEAETQKVDCTITLNGADAACDGDGAVFKDGVLTISKGGCYRISGTLDDGRIEVNATKDDDVSIVLDGVDVTCSDSAPFAVWQADNTMIYLAEGTSNRFVDTREKRETDEDEEEEDPTAAIYSKDDLGFSGEGKLTVAAGYNDGIASKDDLWFDGGTYSITAVDDALVGKDSVAVKTGSFTLTAADDAVKSSKEDDEEKGFVSIEGGSFTIQAGDDGIHAENAIVIAGGDITIEKCYEGIEAETIVFSGGNVEVAASDDGINAANGTSTEGMDGPGGMRGQGGMNSQPQDENSTGTIFIEDGEIYVDADGDGLDSNGSIMMTGGTVYIEGPVNDGNGILDYNTEFVMSGGSLVGAGSSGMLQSISDSSGQPGMAVVFSSTQTAGTKVVITDKDGKEIASCTPSKSFSAVVVSNDKLQLGETYSISLNGTEYTTMELTSVSTSNGRMEGGMGGGPGGGRTGGNPGKGGRTSGVPENGGQPGGAPHMKDNTVEGR